MRMSRSTVVNGSSGGHHSRRRRPLVNDRHGAGQQHHHYERIGRPMSERRRSESASRVEIHNRIVARIGASLRIPSTHHSKVNSYYYFLATIRVRNVKTIAEVNADSNNCS
ncbi:unnamed protein product [Toxocara canis]|uniref:Uncharacterized protein n=1 Tax=Toxocara canis TaxID=6265 RepID=A0A183UYS7_TOXCA|nr:unnamed protein product [Toxocara canis]